MEGARSAMINGGSLSQRFNSGRLIPKRGQKSYTVQKVLCKKKSYRDGRFRIQFYRRGSDVEELFRPANSQEGSGEDGNRGGISQFRGFNLQSSSSINAHGSSLSNS
ncbi:hypothetical protein D8674_002156 [Pyrus ussuriensis x Pyrus communis]|uniref:Uncharacterized protein n=1 Tax=Pyrus ussuriensis x Pyrus communis TaxID=2448454 RepID=A0A5N5FHC9_9ROSA|nr:hypothetical protein D8674_002156 [Pyrus ussuriensis x Pyrus communis]